MMAAARSARTIGRMSPSSTTQATRRQAPEVGTGRVILWCVLAGMAFWPRLWILGFWIFDRQIGDAFSNWIVPALGFVFFPWTTLLYAWMWSINSSGVHGWEWIFVVIGVASDLFFWIAGRSSLR
jgi:hypothetical protein